MGVLSQYLNQTSSVRSNDKYLPDGIVTRNTSATSYEIILNIIYLQFHLDLPEASGPFY